MNDFKVGDRVEYVGNVSSVMLGKVGVVVEPPFANSGMVYWSESYGADSQSLRHVTPAPSVITINRADLPEVRQEGDSVVIIRGKGCIYTANHNPETARASAADFIALAEFLEAREKAAEEAASAEKEAAELLNKRRYELAEVVAKNAGWNVWAGTEYADHQCEAQAAIDMMIAAEADRG